MSKIVLKTLSLQIKHSIGQVFFFYDRTCVISSRGILLTSRHYPTSVLGSTTVLKWHLDRMHSCFQLWTMRTKSLCTYITISDDWKRRVERFSRTSKRDCSITRHVMPSPHATTDKISDKSSVLFLRKSCWRAVLVDLYTFLGWTISSISKLGRGWAMDVPVSCVLSPSFHCIARRASDFKWHSFSAITFC
jgi:hypothetical protein